MDPAIHDSNIKPFGITAKQRNFKFGLENKGKLQL